MSNMLRDLNGGKVPMNESNGLGRSTPTALAHSLLIDRAKPNPATIQPHLDLYLIGDRSSRTSAFVFAAQLDIIDKTVPYRRDKLTATANFQNGDPSIYVQFSSGWSIVRHCHP